MKSTSSSTYSKMRALREAQKLGCSGAHKNTDGRWMPCSSHAKLTEVAPFIASRTRNTISQNRSQRALKGSNKIKKQWENLGERGVLNLSNLSNGGLVSGSSTGSFGGDMGGVSAKALPNIFGPRDNDVDVFTDIESARQRARQLGCIGVSRRISKTGSTVWMPCTNMSDYASRAGTTALGRRNQQARLERVVNEAIEKRLRRDAKRQKKSLSDDLTFKALGGGIGGRLGRPATFDPNAWDGDSDGRLQDNTPFERPSVPGVNAPDIVGMSSRNRPRLDIGDAQQRSIEGGDTAFSELPLSRKAKRFARKYLKSFESKFEPVEEKYQFYSDSEIIELISSSFPSTPDELKQLLKENPFTKDKWRTVWSRYMQSDPDFEATQAMRDKFISSVRDSPGTIEMVRRYGIPPIVATNNVPSLTWYGNITESWGDSGGGWSHLGIIAMNPSWRDGAYGYKIEDAIRHEMAHSWEAMAAVQNDNAREHYALTFSEMYESLIQMSKRKDVVTSQLSYQDASWGNEEEHASAKRISEYATTARIEWLAESIAALTSSDPAKRFSVDAVAKENISESFGIPLWEVEQIFTPTDKFGGFRSQISDIPTVRDPNNPSLSDFIKERYDDDADISANLKKWVQQNPQYMSDMPLSIQLSSRPEVHSAYRRSVTEGFRSYNSSGVIGSGGREMGKKILDRVDPEKTNQDEPTLYFVGGTTGSGKSTLVKRGIMEGVPNENQSAHIDPDEIKTGLVGWNGGQGASSVHQASRVATDKVMNSAAEQRMHMVVQGTGKRREHLIDMKRRGYKTSGHFVWIPDDVADQRVAQRKQRGGANIPTYFGSQIAHELRSGPSSVSRQITDGLYDEFFLYDNSEDTPRLVAKRLSDGSFEIMDDAVFDSFFSKKGADFVRDYWKKSAKPNQMMSGSGQGMRSRNDKGQSVAKDEILGGMVFRGFGPRSPITSRDLEKHNLRLADMSGAFIDARTDFRNRNADFIKLPRAHANAVNFTSSSLFGADFRNLSAMNAIFGDGKSKPADLRYSILSAGQFVGAQFDGVNMSGSYMVSTNMRNGKFRNTDFSDAVMWDVDFRGADLRGSNITTEQLMNSRFDETTKLPDGLELPIRRQVVVASTKPFMPKIPTSVIAGDDIDVIRGNMENGKLSINGPIDQSSIELRRRNLSESQIANTSLSKSILDGSSLSESRLENVDLANSSLFRVNMSKSELTGVNFARSLLSGSSFRGATLGRNVSFRNANLSDADFRGAKVLGKIDLRGADLTGAILHGVDLRNAIFDEKTNFTNAIGLDRNKIPASAKKAGLYSRSYSSLSSEEMIGTPGRTLLARANDSLIQIGKFKNAKRSDTEIDSLLGEINRIYDHLNSIPGLIEDAIYRRTDIDAKIKKTNDAIDGYGTFTYPDGSTQNVAQYIANNDRSGYVKAIRSSGKNTTINTPLKEWDKIESLLLDMDRLKEQRDSVVEDLTLIRNKSNSAVATESMLSDYGVMNNLNNLPDFSIAEPIKPRRPKPAVASVEMRPEQMARYNSINRPKISQIPKSPRVERAIKRVDGMASKSKPTSQQGRASRAQEIYKSVSDALIAALEEANDGNWERPWNLGTTIPKNASTGKQYKGFNTILFALVQQNRKYDYPVWATYKQWEALGAQVQRGEKGLTGIKWVSRERDVNLPDGTPTTDTFLTPSAFTVFNIAQVTGVNPDDFLPPRLSPEERIPALEEIFGQILPNIKTINGDSAYYSPASDYINMPPFSAFKDASAYYATLSHELVHWTGHKDRTDRPNMNRFGTPEYAFEELVAEIGSAYLMAILGMEATPQEQHAQYLKSWIKILKDDPSSIQRAASQAQKAVDYLIAQSPKLQELSTPINISQDLVEEA